MRRFLLLPALGAVALLGSALRHGAARPTNDVESLPSPAGPGSTEPNFSVAPDGRVYLSWLERLDASGEHALRVAHWSGSRWSRPATIRTGRDFFVNWADFPSVEALGGGRLVAHWLQRTGTGTYAYGVRIAQSRDDGATWTAPLTPHSDTSNNEHGFVALWRDQRNQVGLAWLDGRKYQRQTVAEREMMLMEALLDENNGFVAREGILDSRVCDCCQTAAAMTSIGPIVVYRDRSAEEIRDIYVTRRLDEMPQTWRRWTTPKPVHRDGWRINACPVNGPAIAAHDKLVSVAWFTAANDSIRVNTAFSFDAGGAFGQPIRIDDGNPSGRVDVALLTDGSALVSWVERTGGDTAAVRVRRARADGRTGPAVSIATSSAARSSGFPRLAVSGRYAYVAWTLPGSPPHVRVARVPLASFQ